MILSMSAQARFFLLTALAGFLTAFLFDLFRVLRRLFRHPNFLTQAEDVVYWILSILAVFYIFLRANAQMRVFSFVGLFLGMLLYFLTLSYYIRLILNAVTGFVKRVVITAVKIVTFPLKALFTLLVRILRLLGKLLKKPLRRTKNALQTVRRCARIRAVKFKGDLIVIRKKV